MTTLAKIRRNGLEISVNWYGKNDCYRAPNTVRVSILPVEVEYRGNGIECVKYIPSDGKNAILSSETRKPSAKRAGAYYSTLESHADSICERWTNGNKESALWFAFDALNA